MIGHQRMADRGEMHADLMGAPGYGPSFDERYGPIANDKAHHDAPARDRCTRIFCVSRTREPAFWHIGTAFNLRDDSSRILLHMSHNEREICFVNDPHPELLLQVRERVVRFRRKQHTGGRAI